MLGLNIFVYVKDLTVNLAVQCADDTDLITCIEFVPDIWATCNETLCNLISWLELNIYVILNKGNQILIYFWLTHI